MNKDIANIIKIYPMCNKPLNLNCYQRKRKLF